LYAVLEGQLQAKSFLAGPYSIADIADIAVLPWVYRHVRHGIDLADYPSVLNWYTELMARSAVATGFSVGEDLMLESGFNSAAAKNVFFTVRLFVYVCRIHRENAITRNSADTLTGAMQRLKT